MVKNKEQAWQKVLVTSDVTIKRALELLEESALQVLLIVNQDSTLEGTLTDGDIRRGLLHGHSLENSIASIVHRDALVVPPNLNSNMVLEVMRTNKVRQIPIVGSDRKILGLHTWDDLEVSHDRNNLMVVMAGGRGKRLRPLTDKCPKPLLEVAGKPMLEHIIERAKSDGFGNFLLSVNYLSEMIEDYFGDGTRFGVAINYIKEDFPLGTAGSLGLLNPIPKEPILVTNCDILSRIKYSGLLDFHLRHNAKATMTVHRYNWKCPYGVVEMEGINIIGFQEKPVFEKYINAGVYVITPEALSILGHNEHCDMPTLFEKLQHGGNTVIAYPIHEPWLDLGNTRQLKELTKLGINSDDLDY